MMIYDLYIFITPIRFIDTVEKLQYFILSHYASFIKIPGITALCTSLNLINYSSHLKETEKKKRSINFLRKFISMILHVVVLHVHN